MNSDQKNIHLLIAQKLQELKTLKEEWKEASLYPGDTDYEYLALLYPIITDTGRELDKFMKLATNNYAGELHFPIYIRQLLNNECHSLEIHVELRRGSYVYFKGPLMVFERMKQRHAISARLLQHGELAGHFHEDNLSQLHKLSWKRHGRKDYRLKYFIRNEEDLKEFHSLIACTFMEPLSALTEWAKEQYFVVIPSPV